MMETYRLLRAKRIGWKTAGAILLTASAFAGVHLSRPSGPDCYDSMGGERSAQETPDASKYVMTEHYGGGRKYPFNYTCVFDGPEGELRLSFIDGNKNRKMEQGEMTGWLNGVIQPNIDHLLPTPGVD